MPETCIGSGGGQHAILLDMARGQSPEEDTRNSQEKPGQEGDGGGVGEPEEGDSQEPGELQSLGPEREGHGVNQGRPGPQWIRPEPGSGGLR